MMKLLSRYGVLFLLFGSLAMISGCLPIADDLRFNIRMESLDGLKQGDRVYFKDYPVGKVESIRVSKDGFFIVQVCIQDAQRAAALKSHLFILDDDPELPGKKAIMVKKGNKPSTVPIHEGETVTGFSSLSYFLQKNRETIRETTEELGQTFDQFMQELKELPHSEQYREMKKSLQESLEELLKEGERYKEKVQQEILPELQKQLDEFKQKFQAEKPETPETPPGRPEPQPERHNL
jgi:paraquat-inducible protein B